MEAFKHEGICSSLMLIATEKFTVQNGYKQDISLIAAIHLSNLVKSNWKYYSKVHAEEIVSLFLTLTTS